MSEIGHYRVEHEIGRGGMAVVYLARQLDLDRPVALKKLAGLHASDPTVITRFVREARLAGSLNHPNIVTVHEYFEHAGLPYIAMEFLPRGPLRPLVGVLTLPQVAGVLDSVLAGLVHAHEQRIVHRDLKPENLMRTNDGGVKIADFGIAKAYDELATANLTPPGEFMGAPAYVSPEQALGSPATPASDLYSVGVIAFELLTGAVPFVGAASASALLIHKVNERPPTVRSQRPDLDKALADWVDNLLERDPSRRPTSARVARESLEDAADTALGTGWRHDAPLPAPSADPAPPPSPPAPPRRFARARTLRAHAPYRQLSANALRNPTNVLVGGAIAIAAVLLTPLLFAVAAAAYLAMAATTFFDESEAARVARSKQPASQDHRRTYHARTSRKSANVRR